MNDTTWLTATDAAKILRVSIRQVHRYAENNQLVTRRAGRRVLFDSASVAKLADDLAVDVRPPSPQSRELISPELARYLAEQSEAMRRQGESAERIESQLEALQQQVQQPARIELPRWLVRLLIVITLLLLAILILTLLRV